MDGFPTIPPSLWLLIGVGTAIFFRLVRLANRNAGTDTRPTGKPGGLRKHATVREWKQATDHQQKISAWNWALSLSSRGLIDKKDIPFVADGLVYRINGRLLDLYRTHNDSDEVHQIGWDIAQQIIEELAYMRRRQMSDAKSSDTRPRLTPEQADHVMKVVEDWLDNDVLPGGSTVSDWQKAKYKQKQFLARVWAASTIEVGYVPPYYDKDKLTAELIQVVDEAVTHAKPGDMDIRITDVAFQIIDTTLRRPPQ